MRKRREKGRGEDYDVKPLTRGNECISSHVRLRDSFVGEKEPLSGRFDCNDIRRTSILHT